jgi:DNA gyrase/topoisomerase IV subunit B
MVKSYTAKDIRTIGDIESIRINPSMQIGSTENPTHLIEEALDNSIDEALSGVSYYYSCCNKY